MSDRPLSANAASGETVPCEDCPLRRRAAFRSLSEDELHFIERLKIGEATFVKGQALLTEGTRSPYVYTVLHGWGFRYKLLEDGRRQILNYALSGDFLGLQASVFGDTGYSVEALGPLRACVFQRERLWELYKSWPSLAFDLTWLAAREERILDDNLLSVGRRSALERVAYLVMHLFARAESVGLATGDRLTLPITQQHVADTLGLSLVHTNKTLSRLVRLGLLRWHAGSLALVERDKLAALAGFDLEARSVRPLI